jgi:DNA-binding transcriptional MerR regulator
MPYTIHTLAKLAGFSVRTLHYYDEISLLFPASIQKNGYRQYEEPQLIRLQQILFFRELDFELSEIKEILNRPNYSIVGALREQKKMIELKRNRLDKLITTINKTITVMTDNQPIKADELYDAFKDDDVKKYQAEVKERWGTTDAYKQSTAKVAKMTKVEMEVLKEKQKKLTQKLADAMELPVESAPAQTLIAEHYKGIQFFYDCPTEMYRNLGEMYVNDQRFTAYYDKFRPGLAVWLRDAINHFCDAAKKN